MAASRKSSKRLAVGLPVSRIGASFPPVKVVRVAIPGRAGVVVVDMMNDESDKSEIGEGSREGGRGVAEGV